MLFCRAWTLCFGLSVYFMVLSQSMAQFDANGPNAILTINNLVPSTADPLGHIVSVAVPGNFELRVSSGANPGQPFILAAGPLNPATFSTPWGGTLDLGLANPMPPFIPTGVVIVIDTVFNSVTTPFSPFAFTPYTLSFSVGSLFATTMSPGLQAIVADPSAPPFFLDNTEAGQAAFETVTKTFYSGIADDAFVTHTLDQSMAPSPVSVSYGGATYTQFFISSNGVITFSAGTGDFFPNTSEFFAGWQVSPTTAPNPGVAVWQDMARASVMTDSICVTEERTQNVVTIEYLNQEHWDSQLNSGSFSIRFGDTFPAAVTIDLAGFVVGDPFVDAGPLVGVSTGDDTNSTSRVADISADITMGYITSMGSEGIAEDFNPSVTLGGVLDIPSVTFLDIGAGTMANPYFTWVVM